MTKNVTFTDLTTDTVRTIPADRGEYAGTTRDRLARCYAEMIGGHVVGLKLAVVSVYAGPAPITAAEHVAAFAAQPVATFAVA